MTQYDLKFSECYKSLAPILIKFVCRKIRDWHTAEEIVQEIFAYLYQKTEIMERDTKDLVGFLFRAARCRVSDYRRKQTRHPVFYGEIELTPDSSSFSEIENHIIEKETFDEITRMINNEPQRVREIFVRSYRDGQAIRRISRELSMSENTISRILKRFSSVVREKIGSPYV
jgi:RNA polymerase sigma-70 factor (ECF subfamily)